MRDFHPIAPAFPAKSPGPQGRAFPIVFDKPHIMQRGIDTNRRKTFQIELLKIRRGRFQQHLELVIMLQPVWVFAIAAITGTTRRLDIGRAPGSGSERPQSGGGMKRARTHLHVVRLQRDTAIIGPEAL